MKLLGLDYGESKVGLALADTEAGVALPFKILKRLKPAELLAELKKICVSESIEKIVIGLPINLRAKSSGQTKVVEDFIVLLKEKIKLPVETQDERYTTQAAQKLSPGSGDDDAIAAMLILQSYLDRN